MMTRLEFLQEIFKFFGKKDEDLLRTYDIALTTKDNIDWQKLYKKVITEAESRYLPTPKWFLGMMPSFIIVQPGQYKYETGTSVLKLKDRFYVYDMWHNTHSIDELHNHYKNKYGDNFVWFKYYPPEFFVMGNNIYDTRKGFREPVEVI